MKTIRKTATVGLLACYGVVALASVPLDNSARAASRSTVDFDRDAPPLPNSPHTPTIILSSANVMDFGAVSDDRTKAAANQAAFQKAFKANPNVSCPDGSAFYVQTITIPPHAKTLRGRCTLIAAGTLDAAVLVASRTTDLAINDVKISVDVTSFPNISGLFTISTIRTTILRTAMGGKFGMFDSKSIDIRVQDCLVSGYGERGIYIQGAAGSIIEHCHVDGTGATSHGISIEGGSDTEVIYNRIFNTTQFGISIAGNQVTYAPFTNASVTGNLIKGSVIEGINFNNVQHFTAAGNVAIFTSTSTDFGISVFGSSKTSPPELALDGTITGNMINGSCKSAIAVADRSERINVTGNVITQPNACNRSTGDHVAGIVFYGGAALHNSAAGNMIFDPLGSMRWQVGEWNDGTGNPDFNYAGVNFGAPGTLGAANILGLHSNKANQGLRSASPLTPDQ